MFKVKNSHKYMHNKGHSIRTALFIAIGIIIPLSAYEDRAPIAKRAKNWTILIYLAADNDLKEFSVRNIKQMSVIGSNENLNIVVQLDIKALGNKKITRRYYIEKNKVLHMNADDPATQAMDSGDENSLISFCEWGIKNYPANNYALVLWNHGSGFIDPQKRRLFNTLNLFNYNPVNNKLELDRTIGYLDLISATNDDEGRGVCWDDTTGNYLTNQKLNSALNKVCTNYLHKKFSIIGFDACLMGMLEVENVVEKYADFMVASQEVEPGTGWNYQRVFEPFTYGTLNAHDFAAHIVDAYKKEYQPITNDYTLSAVDLSLLDTLERNVNTIAAYFMDGLKQRSSSFKTLIRASVQRTACTHFDEPSYIDLHHFYKNILANLDSCSFEDASLKENLEKALRNGCSIIKQMVVASEAGSNLSKARGISIYFPERRIHQSYGKTSFVPKDWFTFLKYYLLL